MGNETHETHETPVEPMAVFEIMHIALQTHGEKLYDILCTMRGPDNCTMPGHGLAKLMTSAVVRWEIGARSGWGACYSADQARVAWAVEHGPRGRNAARKFWGAWENSHFRNHAEDAAHALHLLGRSAMVDLVRATLYTPMEPEE